MSFEKAMNKMKFDLRLLEYNLAQGLISKEDYNKYLAELEDCAHLVAPATAAVADVEEDTDVEDTEADSH